MSWKHKQEDSTSHCPVLFLKSVKKSMKTSFRITGIGQRVETRASRMRSRR